jgi:hypothetical protein
MNINIACRASPCPQRRYVLGFNVVLNRKEDSYVINC